VLNFQSLEVSYVHLSTEVPTLAIWLADAPKGMLEVFNEVATAVVLQQFDDYSAIHDSIFVRITDLPVSDSLRSLRQTHLDALVKVCGVVTRRSQVFPQLKLVKFNCVKCGTTVGPYTQNFGAETKPGACPECQSSGPFQLNAEQTVYQNYQRITLQESPGSVPAGRVPRHKEVILFAIFLVQIRCA
jgi:DNA replication licensing factor MCM2